jgi:hypothetical protein
MSSSSNRRKGGRGSGAGAGRGGAQPAGKGAKGGGKGGGKPSGGGSRGGGKPSGKPRPERLDKDDAVAQLAGPLAKVLDRLPETQRRVLELRMGLVDGHPQKLTEVAQQLGMTMHEAKQVEQRAFEHIREAVPLDRLQKLLKS